MNKFPHNKYYYLLSMLVLGVPSVLGALWSRRKDIRYAPCFYYSFSREGIPLFDNYLQIQGKSRAAAQKATSEVFFLFYCIMMQICVSRFVLGITQFTLPLLCIRPVERRYNMFFYTFQKNLFFTGIFSPYSLSLIRVVFLVWFVPLQCLLCHFYAFWNTQEGHLCR